MAADTTHEDTHDDDEKTAASIAKRGAPMAEIRPDVRQAAAIAKLLTSIRTDAKLRMRLAGDPAPVLKEYGLDSLLQNREVQVAFDILSPGETVTIGGAQAIFGWHADVVTPHADAHAHFDLSRPHSDANPHQDTPAAHLDSSHQDLAPHHFDF